MKKYFVFAMAIVFALTACKNNTTETPAKKIDSKQFFKENIAKVEQLCKEEAAQDDYDLDMASYVFYDIDSDGIDELYIRDSLADCGWLFCCGADSLQFVTSENYKLHFSQLGNIIMLSGSAGTGTFYSAYYEIENSVCTGPDFFELNEFVWGSEDSTRTVYHPVTDFDGDYPEEKTRPFFAKVKEFEKTSEWNILSEGKEFKPLYELTGRVPEDEQ
ncbi:MAG: hypothetical protein IJK74_03215 [Bacteroidales bacterium]|nr:hypothetical protein [Bacteroidales bacterium]